MIVTCKRFNQLHGFGGFQCRYQKNTLQGFAEFLIEDIGLLIRDCTLHESHDKRWIGYPAKPWTNTSGEESWMNIIRFPTETDNAEFQEAALNAIDKYNEV
tara:strand:+ start:3687 stop:3989 length:303 start_codon:yes stop_codon:yes gene_type:complete